MLSGIPENSRHSLLEYYSFAQNFLSALVSWLDYLLFMSLLEIRAGSSLVNLFRSLLMLVRVVLNLKPYLLAKTTPPNQTNHTS